MRLKLSGLAITPCSSWVIFGSHMAACHPAHSSKIEVSTKPQPLCELPQIFKG